MIKKVAIAILIVTIASLAICGCTASNPTQSPTTSQQTSIDTSSAITQTFSERNYTIVTPFTKSTNGVGDTTYKGVVQDGSEKLTPYTHNITIEVCKNRTDANTRFNSWKNIAIAQGYTQQPRSQDFDSGRLWDGSKGTSHAYIIEQQPNVYFGIIYNADASPVSVAALHNDYVVSIDYASRM